MCGIAGAIALQPDVEAPSREAVERMVGAMAHRGPDECGRYRDDRVALGHARLAIIDVATGQQPMSDASGERWLVFNGEIFNYVELRAELIAAGHRFRTESDTEVIIEAWEAWGEAAFARFNGQFAIALWDAPRERLVLARDRLGVRPLHVCEHDGRLWFASEVKAIFAADPTIPRAFDPVGLAETFTFWSTVAPRTAWAGVSELEPGHVRVISREGTTDRAYWAPRYPSSTSPAYAGTIEDATREVRSLLADAVRLRIERADVPVGSYLSGGLDSSLIAALGHGVKGDRFKTFSIRFEDAEFDETPYQRAMVERIGSEHHDLVVGRRAIAEAFPAVVDHAERPILRTAPAPMYLLSELVHSEGIKVVLTGEGADEMFAGYDLFREGAVRRFWARRPESELRPRLLEGLYPYLARSPVAQRAMARRFFGRDLDRWQEPGFAHGPRWQSTAAIQRLFALPLQQALAGTDVTGAFLDRRPPAFASWGSLAQDQFLEVRTLMSGYILSSQGDRMLMAHSVEGRFPFLDTRLVEFADSLPASYKLLGLDEKHVLKRVAAGLVPDAIIKRTKQPYRAPDAAAFVGPGAPAWVGEVMRPETVADAAIFDPDGVARLWRKCTTNDGVHALSNGDNMALVGILSTGLLYEGYIRHAPPEPAPLVWTIAVDRGSRQAMTAGAGRGRGGQ
jgi:asparagine synthase (glutamine-hydrolysing)